jgi:signal transduction histidine kinase
MVAGPQDLHPGEGGQSQLLAQERERIAGILHDRIEQQIFSIGLAINSLLEDFELGRPLVERLLAVRRLAVETADEVRRAVFALAVPGQGGGGLTADLQSLLRDFERRSGLKAHLVVNGTAFASPGPAGAVLCSVISEALTNVERHAQAQMVLVSIRFVDDRAEVVIQDDGAGVPDLVLNSFPDSYLHFGLQHMRRQVLDLAGDFEVAKGDEGGTVLRFGLKLSAEPT